MTIEVIVGSRYVLEEKVKHLGGWYTIGVFGTIERASIAKRSMPKSGIYKYRIRRVG